MEEKNEAQDTGGSEKDGAAISDERIKHAGYGIFSIVIAAFMLCYLLIFAFNSAILAMTSDEPIFNDIKIVRALHFFSTSGMAVSFVGIFFGIVGMRQKNRKRIMPIAGITSNIVFLFFVVGIFFYVRYIVNS